MQEPYRNPPALSTGQSITFRPRRRDPGEPGDSYENAWVAHDVDGSIIDQYPKPEDTMGLDEVAKDVMLAQRKTFMQGIQGLRDAGYPILYHEADALFTKAMRRVLPPTKKATRETVYAAIDGERDYQDKLPLCQGDGTPKSVGEFLTLLRAYTAKADSAWTDNPGDEKALHVIRKLAGLAVHCMEIHGAPKREATSVTATVEYL